MAKLIMKKLNGSTLVEVTVAAVILVVVFLLVSMLIADLWKSGPSERKLYAHTYLQKLAMRYKVDEPSNQYEAVLDGLKYDRKIEVYNDYPDLKVITLSLRDTTSDKVFDQIKFLYRQNAKD